MEQALIRRVAFVIFACRVPFDQPHEHPDLGETMRSNS